MESSENHSPETNNLSDTARDGSPMADAVLMDIPLEQIKFDPENPRHGCISQAEVDVMEKALLEVGQKTPAKVRPTGPEEYTLIGGEIRLRGARQAGLPTLKAWVMKVTPQEALEEAIYDNLSQKMGWLNEYVTIETLKGLRPELTQEQIGNRLKKKQSWVSEAQKLLKLLNKPARELIYRNSINQDDHRVPVACVERLIDLATGGDDDQAKIEVALGVVLDRQMTEPQVKNLVAWMRKGNSPESFPVDGKLSGQKGSKQQRFDPNDPHAELWKGLPKNIQAHKTPKGYKVVWNLQDHEAPLAVYGGLNYLQYSQTMAGEKAESRYHDALPDLVAKAAEVRKAKGSKADSATSSAPSPISPSPLGKLEEAFQQKAGTTGAAVVSFVWANLWRDFKSAVNMLIKQFFRRYLKRAL